MNGRNALKENLGLVEVNARVNPLWPSRQTLSECLQAVHIFSYGSSWFYVIPSAIYILINDLIALKEYYKK